MSCGCKGKKSKPVARRGFTASAKDPAPKRPAIWTGNPDKETK